MTFIKLDLHIHTSYSGDSLIKPEDVVNYVKLKGLDGFAITDHQTLKGYKLSKKNGALVAQFSVPKKASSSASKIGPTV